MYSIPVYALRFAAHCRSRLRFSELSAADVTRVTPETTKAWIRFSRNHERVRVNCTTLRPARSGS